MSNNIRMGIGIWRDDAFWVQVNETVYRRGRQHPVELIPLVRSNFFSAGTADERSALLEEIVAQELDVIVGWSFPESVAYTVLDSGVPIVHLSETSVEHPLSVSPLGLQKVAEQLAHHIAALLEGKGHVLAIGGLLREELPDDGRSRICGIQNAFREYPGIHFDHLLTDWTYEGAAPRLYEVLERWPYPIDALFGFSDSLALLGQSIALELGRCSPDTVVVGINGDPMGLAAIIEGRMAATVETSATNLANHAFDIALNIASGQPYPAHFEYNPRLITADNVASIAAEKLVAVANLPTYMVGFERSEQQEYQDYLETSLDISRQIGSVLDYQRLPVELARLIRTNYAFDHVQLLYWSEREQALVLMEDDDSTTPSKRIPVLKAGVLGEAVMSDKAIFIPDSQRSIRYAPDSDWSETRSRVILPIRQGGTVLGLLDLHAYRVVHCTRPHLMGLQSLADQIGVAVQNAQLYKEALEARAIAERADRLKSRLLANISHELRNPLHVILSCAGRMDMLVSSQGESQQIQKNALHLMRLIDDLLDLSRAEIDELSITPEVIEPKQFITDVYESIAADNDPQESGVNWHLELPASLPMLQADPDRLRQILLNLLINAKKFTTSGDITLGAEVSAPYFHLWVQDTGIGIPAQQQALIFEPFTTLHDNSTRKREGVGLGLSVTRRLVALHGGLMTVDSQHGEGSTFHVYLPLPTLGNTPVVNIDQSQPVMLIVSSKQALSLELLQTCWRQGLEACHVRTYEDIDAALNNGLPRAIAWDADAASESEWLIVQRLRSHPQVCSLPFLLYRQMADSLTPALSRLTSVFLKPVKPKTLLNLINGIFLSDETGTILVIDDDEEARTLYQNMVQAQFPAYSCRSAANGKEALAIMESVAPSLVILDLLMPEMDGFEVIQWMRANRATQGVPIAVLSGKVLSLEDIKRLEPYQKVTCHSKNVLSDDEFASSLQQMLFDNHGLPAHTSGVVKRAVAYIHQHYEESLSRADIAHALGVSENYLTHIFHKELGIALWDYLNRYRVMQAKELLRQTQNSVAFISSQVGFDDPAYFSRVFRRYVGQSPRLYRNAPALKEAQTT